MLTLRGLRAAWSRSPGATMELSGPKIAAVADVVRALRLAAGRPAGLARHVDGLLRAGPLRRAAAPGPDNPLRAVEAPDPPDDTVGIVAEIQRGIWETTGLDSDLVRPGWLGIPCESRRMAAWMCAAIILENVDALCEGEQLLVPASERFGVENEVKSVITVVAKIHHYWIEHVCERGSG